MKRGILWVTLDSWQAPRMVMIRLSWAVVILNRDHTWKLGQQAMKFVILIQIILLNKQKASWATILPKVYSNWVMSKWNSGIQNLWWHNNRAARINKPMRGSCNSSKRVHTWNTSKIWVLQLREPSISSLCRPKIRTRYRIWMTLFSLKIGASKK